MVRLLPFQKFALVGKQYLPDEIENGSLLKRSRQSGQSFQLIRFLTHLRRYLSAMRQLGPQTMIILPALNAKSEKAQQVIASELVLTGRS